MKSTSNKYYIISERICLYGRPEAVQMRSISSIWPLIYKKGCEIMDITTITQFIGTLGFPIAACCVLFWYLQKESENHKQEMNNMKDAIDANTSIITELKILIQQIAGKIRND